MIMLFIRSLTTIAKEAKMDQIDQVDVNLPKVSFWDVEAPIGTIVNPEDFRLGTVNRIYDGHSWRLQAFKDSFFTTDLAEAVRRQQINRFFLENREFSLWIRENILSRYETQIPHSGSDLIAYFIDTLANTGKESNFFWKCKKFVINVRKCKNIPPELEIFVQFLEKNLNSYKELETSFVKSIEEKLKGDVYLRGTITFGLDFPTGADNVIQDKELQDDLPWDTEVTEKHRICYSQYVCRPFLVVKGAQGFVIQRYAASYNPNWETKFKAKKTGLGKLFNRRNERKHKLRMQEKYEEMTSPLVYSHVPSELAHYIKKKIEQTVLVPYLFEETFSRLAETTNDMKIHVAYNFDDQGLVVQIIGVESQASAQYELNSIFQYGKTNEMIKLLPSQNKELRSLEGDFKDRIGMVNNLRLYSVLQEMCRDEDVLNKPIPIDQSFIDSIEAEYRWHGAFWLVGEELSEVYEKIQAFHDYVSQVIEKLSAIAPLMDPYYILKSLGVNICFPELRPMEENVLKFTGLIPFRLVQSDLNFQDYDSSNTKAKKKFRDSLDEVVPLDLPIINGDLLTMSGQNGAGKSESGLAVFDAVYLGQSGLPIIAESAIISIKRGLGLAMLERKDGGSTAQLYVRKIKSLFTALERYQEHSGFLLFIDELGTGTGEIGGLEFGIKVMRTLKGVAGKTGSAKYHGISVIMSTQIIGLAEYTKNELGANCVKFLPEHKIVPGIGDGNIAGVVTEEGLDDYLV